MVSFRIGVIQDVPFQTAIIKNIFELRIVSILIRFEMNAGETRNKIKRYCSSIYSDKNVI